MAEDPIERAESYSFQRIPFQSTKLEEERKNRDQVNVDLDKDLRLLVNRVKGRLNMPADAAAMKIMLEAGGNAIINLFSVETWKKVSDKERVRFTRKGLEEMLI